MPRFLTSAMHLWISVCWTPNPVSSSTTIVSESEAVGQMLDQEQASRLTVLS